MFRARLTKVCTLCRHYRSSLLGVKELLTAIAKAGVAHVKGQQGTGNTTNNTETNPKGIFLSFPCARSYSLVIKQKSRCDIF
jgi:hypothetical protein